MNDTGAPAGGVSSKAPDASSPDASSPDSSSKASDVPQKAEGSARASRWRAAFFGLAAVGIILGVAWALLGSKLLVVRSVEVTGTRLVPKSEVSGIADVPLGTPLASVDTSAVERRVESIRQVASADVAKSWPDGLTITVRERVPAVAVRMSGRGYDLIDSAGVIVRWSRSLPAGLPLLSTSVSGGDLRGDPGVRLAAAVLGELPRWLSGSVASVTSSQPVTLRLRDGKTVVWGGTDRAAVKGRELAILMRDPARYFDVSAPGTAITR
jgi:cell division protein FtsQ